MVSLHFSSTALNTLLYGTMRLINPINSDFLEDPNYYFFLLRIYVGLLWYTSNRIRNVGHFVHVSLRYLMWGTVVSVSRFAGTFASTDRSQAASALLSSLSSHWESR